MHVRGFLNRSFKNRKTMFLNPTGTADAFFMQLNPLTKWKRALERMNEGNFRWWY